MTEDQKLNAICDERKDGPFVRVDLETIDEHDLTDPHGEAEALRKENARLREELASGSFYKEADIDALMTRAEAAEAALAASRTPDPVANAGSCQPVAWIPTETMQWLSSGDKKAIARITAVHNRPLKSDGGVPVYLHPAAPVAEAQPDWKAMAERLGDVLGDALIVLEEADTAGSQVAADARAALSDLAKMKGE